MIAGVKIKHIFLVQNDKLVQVPGTRIQQVVRKMIKQARTTRTHKMKRSSS
jgi:hypothetical protein